MITTTRDGRNLVIHVDDVDSPFVVTPLPGLAGVQVFETYLGGTGGIGTAEELAEALMMSVDGAVHDEETGRWRPLPEAQRTTYDRIGHELSQAEAEDVLNVSFLWQSALGDDGVRVFLDNGGGVKGLLAALTAFRARGDMLTRRTANAGRPTGAAVPTDRKPKKRKK